MTSIERPETSQLLLQAEIISSLSTQRDLLLQRSEEQRHRWEAEQAGWERSAEALIAQRRKRESGMGESSEVCADSYCGGRDRVN